LINVCRGGVVPPVFVVIVVFWSAFSFANNPVKYNEINGKSYRIIFEEHHRPIIGWVHDEVRRAVSGYQNFTNQLPNSTVTFYVGDESAYRLSPFYDVFGKVIFFPILRPTLASDFYHYAEAMRASIFYKIATYYFNDMLDTIRNGVNRSLGGLTHIVPYESDMVRAGIAYFIERKMNPHMPFDPVLRMMIRMMSHEGDLEGELSRELWHENSFFSQNDENLMKGHILFLYLSDTADVKKMQDLIRTYTITLNFDKTCHMVLKRHYNDVWKDALTYFQKDSMKKIEIVKSEKDPYPTERNVIPLNRPVLDMKLSHKTSTLAFVEKHQNEHVWRTIDFVSGKASKVTSIGGGNSVAWGEDDHSLFYLKTHDVDQSNTDIVMNKDGNETVLVKNAFARAIDFSVSSGLLFYIEDKNGIDNLKFYNRVRNESYEMTNSTSHDIKFSSPSMMRDENRYVLSGISSKNSESIFMGTLGRYSTVSMLTQDGSNNIQPSFSPFGDYIVFSSDRNGVFNIYAIDPYSKRFYQLTNVMGGAFFPVVDHDNQTLYFVEYDGLDRMGISRVKVNFSKLFDKGKFTEASQIRLVTETLPLKMEKELEKASEAEFETSLRFAAQPFVRLTQSGFRLGPSLMLVDDLGFNRYHITAAYDTMAAREYVVADYHFHYIPPYVTIHLEDTTDFIRQSSVFRNDRGGYIHFGVPKNSSLYTLGVTVNRYSFDTENFTDKMIGGFSFEWMLGRMNTHDDGVTNKKGTELSIRVDGLMDFSTDQTKFPTLQLHYDTYKNIFGKHMVRLNTNVGVTGMIDPVYSYFELGGDLLLLSPDSPFRVRGYEYHYFLNQKVATVNAEYYFPILNVYHTIFPWVFLRAMNGLLFSDAGFAYEDGLSTIASIGSELQFRLRLFSRNDTRFRVGYHKALTTDGSASGIFFAFSIPN